MRRRAIAGRLYHTYRHRSIADRRSPIDNPGRSTADRRPPMTVDGQPQTADGHIEHFASRNLSQFRLLSVVSIQGLSKYYSDDDDADEDNVDDDDGRRWATTVVMTM